ncbi:hypothetical protein SF23_14425 [Streptomyces sp. MBRL 10]|nr:hypothetical protein SF23_14425 [Streptomyces sp. MBRL 10]
MLLGLGGVGGRGLRGGGSQRQPWPVGPVRRLWEGSKPLARMFEDRAFVQYVHGEARVRRTPERRAFSR